MKRRFPLATLGLITGTLAAYLAELRGGGAAVCERSGFVPARPTFATALSSLLVHDPDQVAHVAGNMLVLAVLGAVVEPALGCARLLALYVASGLGGVALHWLVQPHAEAALVGASGAILGVMAVAAVLRPRELLAFTVAYIGLNLVGLHVPTPLLPAGTSVACHLGGFATGALVVGIRRARGTRWATA